MTEVLSASVPEEQLPHPSQPLDASEPVGSVFVRDDLTVVTATGCFTGWAMAKLVDLTNALAKEDLPIWMDLHGVVELDLTAARLLSELCTRRGGDEVRLIGPPDAVLVSLVIAEAGRYVWHFAELDDDDRALLEAMGPQKCSSPERAASPFDQAPQIEASQTAASFSPGEMKADSVERGAHRGICRRGADHAVTAPARRTAPGDSNRR